MNITPDSVAVEVEFSHPTYLRLLHHLGDDRDVAEWLNTLAWIQMQKDAGRFEVQATGDLPEDVRTNIELHRQHLAEADDRDREFLLEDMINEFVNIGFDELIEENGLAPETEKQGEEP